MVLIRTSLLSVLVLLQVSLFSTALAMPVTVLIPEEVTVNGGVISLASIGTLTGDDDRIAELGRCKIGMAAQPGYSVVLTPELIRMRLSVNSLNLEEINWQIPASVKVTTAAQTIAGKVMAEQAINAVKARTTGLDCEIKPLVASDVVAPVGNVEYQVSFPSGVHFVGPVNAVVALVVEGHPYRQFGVKLDVELYKNVVITTRALQSGELIDMSDVRVERREVGHTANYYTDINKVAGMFVKRTMTAGTILNSSLIDLPQVVKRGSLLSLVARIGSVEVATTGQALENGSVNQVIKVQNLKSKKVVAAKILDANTAEVLTVH